MNSKNITGRIRAACKRKLPIEVIYTPAFHLDKAQLRIWTGQGNNKLITSQDLLDYAKEAREWADTIEKIAEAVL